MSCDYLALATAGVKGLHPYQPGKPEDELKRELGLEKIVKLASNENPLGPSQLVVDTINKVSTSLCRYPDGNGFALKQALSGRYGLASSQITLGNGSNDVLELIVRAFCDTRSEVIFSEYAFAVYPLATQAVGAKAVVSKASNWGHDLDAMAALVTDQTKIIFIANPNNPTGTYLKKSELDAFLSRVSESVIVVLDEAYCEYIDLEDFPDGLSYLEKYANVIVTRTFSKAWGLAGLRVGFAASSPEIANILNRVRQPFNVNSLALAAAETVLKDADYLARSVEVNSKGMAQLEEGFGKLGLDYIPSVGNFICVDVGDAAGIYQSLLQVGVIVRLVANYQMPNHLRVSIGLPEENKFLLDSLANLL